MDLALFAASAGLTRCISSRFLLTGGGDKTERNLASIQLILVLSFSLFSLSLLEALPSNWSLLLHHDNIGSENRHHHPRDGDDGYDSVDSIAISAGAGGLMTLEWAYTVVLSSLAALILVIFPFLVGGQLLGDLVDRCSLPSSSSLPRFVRVAFGLVASTLRCAQFLCGMVLSRFRQRRQSAHGPILALSRQENGDSNNDATASLGAHRRRFRKRWLLGGLGWVVVTLACMRILAPLAVYSDGDAPFLAVAVSYLTALGLLLSATLNGFGSVSLPHSCLAGLYLEPIRNETIAQAEVELDKVKKSLDDRKSELRGNSSLDAASISTGGASSSSSSWRRSSFADLGGGDVNQRRQVLSSEIEFLEMLTEEMAEDIVEMRFSQKMALEARTPIGQVKSYVGVVFSIVLLLRLCSAVLSAWPRSAERSSRNSSGDVVTMILGWLVGQNLVNRQNFNNFSQFISLIITAFLSVSQIRTFLRTVSAVNRRLSVLYCKCSWGAQDKKASRFLSSENELQLLTGSASYLVASLMGCYFLACIVLTKMMLPAKYGTAFVAALGGPHILQVRVYAVNATFALSALVSTVVLGMIFGIQRQNTFRNQSWTTSATSAPKSSGVESNRSSQMLEP